MQIQNLLIDVKLAEYALNQGLHVEYFMYLVLKSRASTDGKSHINNLLEHNLCSNTVIKNLSSNKFFRYNPKDKHFYLRSTKYIVSKNDIFFVVPFKEITQLSSKLVNGTNKIIKLWNATTIKYLFISIVSSQYESLRPYALNLISMDTKQSPSTIQRALKVFDVARTHTVQATYSSRGYPTKSGPIYMTPNFYSMPIGTYVRGKFSLKKRISLCNV